MHTETIDPGVIIRLIPSMYAFMLYTFLRRNVTRTIIFGEADV